MPGWFVVVAVLVALALCLALAIAVRARRRRLAAPQIGRELATRFPIVMVHGIMGFDTVRVLGWQREYFHDIADHLARRGAEVHRPRLPAAASVPVRARRLAEFISELPAPRVNIIAHSMGGLDARYAIAKLGIGDRVASLITIGTPHHGTPVASIKDNVVAALFRKVGNAVGMASHGLDWLTVDRAQQFNSEIADDGRVLYGCVIAKIPDGSRIPTMFWPSHRYLRRAWGDNDGLVPVSSQRWGICLGEVDADHLAQVGWSPEFDATAVYVKLVTELRGRGL